MKRSNYSAAPIELLPGQYRVFGFPPMTGLLLNKWIEVTESNPPGYYGEADLEIATMIPNLSHIEESHLYRDQERSRGNHLVSCFEGRGQEC